MISQETLGEQLKASRYPLLFATVSGAHLYGFPSADSDYDLRGVHVLPLRNVVGLHVDEETLEKSYFSDGTEYDVVTHDVRKFIGLMLKRNGYVLEQLYSPLVIATSPEHDELKRLGSGCITRHHSHHYLGFADTQWRLFQKSEPRHVKPLLYTFRVLLTGIHLMRTGRIEANLVHLNEEAGLSYLADLIAKKTSGAEHETISSVDEPFYAAEVERLTSELRTAFEVSKLPEAPRVANELNEFLVQLRLKAVDAVT